MKARELGFYFGPSPTGRFNAITDVPGVSVGHVSIIKGEGKLVPGVGPIRTGVTAILPHRGNLYTQKCLAGIQAFNGYGKSTGTIWVEELGLLENPIFLTNSLSVSTVREAGDMYVLQHNSEVGISERTPNVLVFECDDSFLSDMRGMHIRHEHALQAIAAATTGPVAEGNVGAGVGMSCYEFKGGIGSCSRLVKTRFGTWTLGLLVLANFGLREDLIIKGVPVGEFLPYKHLPKIGNSVIVIVATDAPLTKQNLRRLAQRPVLGLARTGFVSHYGSGDIVLTFSNYRWVHNKQVKYIDNEQDEEELFDVFAKAAVEAGEECVLNALFQAENMLGRDNRFREKIPVNRVQQILNQYQRRF